MAEFTSGQQQLYGAQNWRFRDMQTDRQFQTVRVKWPLSLATRLFLLGLFILVAAGLCSAATHTWNGSVSSDWFTADNWTPVGVPGTNDIVNVTNGTISLTGAVAIHGTFNWSGGSISGDGVTIESGGAMNISGTVALENMLTNSGTVTMTGGAYVNVYNNHSSSYNGGIYNLAGALWDIQTNAIIYDEELGDEFFNNAGTVSKSKGADTAGIYVPFTNSATVTNLVGVVEFYGGGILSGGYGVAAGATIDFASGNYTVGVPFAISGLGLCEFTGTSLTLPEDVPANLVLESGSIVLGSGFQNHGAITNLSLSGPTLDGANTVTGAFTWGGGSLTGPLTIESGGELNITGTVALFVLLTNKGTVTMTGGAYVDVYNNHSSSYNGGVYNLAGALWDIQTNAIIYNEELGDEFFNNAGTVSKSKGADTAGIYVPLTNSATVTNLVGGLNFYGGGILNGGYGVAAGATIDFASGNYTVGSSFVISGLGLCEFTGTTLTLPENLPTNLVLESGDLVLGSAFQNNGAITNLTLSGPTLEGANTVTGTFTWAAGSLTGPLTIENGGELNIAGTVTLVSLLTNKGTVTMTGAAYMNVYNNHSSSYNGGIYNLAGALWDIQTNAIIYNEELGNEFFNNAGTVSKSKGADTAGIYVPFTNSATVTNLVGSLNFYGGGILTSGYGIAEGATIDFAAGNYTVGVPFVISGLGLCEFTGTSLTLPLIVPSNLVLASGSLVLGSSFQNHGAITNLTLNGPTLTGTNTVTGMLTWNSGSFSGPMTIESGGTMDISGTVALLSLLTNKGTVTMTGAAYINVYNNHTSSYDGGIYNLTGALWDIQTNAIIYDEELGDEFFINAGTVSKSKGADTASIYVPFTNSGTAEVLAGILSFNGSFVPASGTLEFGASSLGNVGQVDVSGNVALNGTASITWLDGFVPAIGNTFHLINYASHTGTFSSISLASGFVGQGNYNSTFFSVSVTGTGTQTNPPFLSIERESPTTVVLVWPTSASGFDLQTRTNLASGTWSNIALNGIVTVGTNFVFTNTVSGKEAFFRLESP
jgi:cadmium resistance protein CadD (predicted permease)